MIPPAIVLLWLLFVVSGTVILARARRWQRTSEMDELDGDAALRRRPWKGSDLVMVFLFMALMQQGGLLLIERAGQPENGQLILMLIMGAGLQIAGILFMGLLTHLHGCDWQAAFGAPDDRPRFDLRLAMVCYLGIWPVLTVVTPLYHSLLKVFGVAIDWQTSMVMLTRPESPAMLVVLLIMALILAPIVEELLFRGMLLPVLRRRLGIWPAIILSSLLFAAFHLHLPSMAGLFIISVACCLATLIGGSVVPAILLHALFNTVNTLLAWGAQTVM